MRYSHLGCPQLVQSIIDTISASPERAISFREYMDLCLYHPEYGYYTNERLKIGKEGDFYTSSSIGTIMGEMLAASFVKMINERTHSGTPVQLVEWGGGTGRLAKHILDECRDVFPKEYERIQLISVEKSQFHRQMQKECWHEHAERVRWLSPEEWFQQGCQTYTIIYANELLDAFPVHRIEYHNGVFFEIYVSWNRDEQCFVEQKIPLTEGPVFDYVHRLQDEGVTFVDGQKAEVNLAALDWIANIGKWLNSGVLMVIDYGDVSEEIYAPHRMNGTLVCYRRHMALDNPYQHIGEQDLTAHVNFSACIQAGAQAGFREYVYMNQKEFLVRAGILDKLQDHTLSDPFHPIVRKNRAIQQILLGDQMSELFKVLIQYK